MTTCPVCNKSFASERPLWQHIKAKHRSEYGALKQKRLAANANFVRRTGGDKATFVDIANEVFGDLPDGAFFQAARDTFGLEPEDFVK